MLFFTVYNKDENETASVPAPPVVASPPPVSPAPPLCDFHNLATLAEVSMAAAGHTVASRPGLQEEIMKARENLRPKNNVVLKSVQLKTTVTSHQESFPNPARYDNRLFIASHGK